MSGDVLPKSMTTALPSRSSLLFNAAAATTGSIASAVIESATGWTRFSAALTVSRSFDFSFSAMPSHRLDCSAGISDCADGSAPWTNDDAMEASVVACKN